MAVRLLVIALVILALGIIGNITDTGTDVGPADCVYLPVVVIEHFWPEIWLPTLPAPYPPHP